MVCLLAAPWIQLSVIAGNGWPHNALRHHWLMPVSCHFRDCKTLLVTSLTHVSGAITSVQTFTFTYAWELKRRTNHHSSRSLDTNCGITDVRVTGRAEGGHAPHRPQDGRHLTLTMLIFWIHQGHLILTKQARKQISGDPSGLTCPPLWPAKNLA